MKKSAPRRALIAGNWKMHATRAEAVALIDGIKEAAGARDREVVIAPPYTALETAARAIEGTAIGLAGQNLHWEPKGAFTGEISGEMLKDAGCTYVIVGHSERRQYFGETNETVRQKIEAALRAALKPIVCIGETLREREAGETEAVLRRQLSVLEPDDSLVIAYEPVWAIGTGKTATPEIAQEAHAFIKSLIDAPVLYGGSVNPGNAAELCAQPDVDGALVGGASLDVDSFATICRAASRS